VWVASILTYAPSIRVEFDGVFTPFPVGEVRCRTSRFEPDRLHPPVVV
jgi:hypothetical protein